MEVLERFRELSDSAAAAMAAADYRALRQLSAEIGALGEASGDRTVCAWGDYYLGVALIYNNEGGPAYRALRRALATFRQNEDRFMAARTMVNLAMIEADINLDRKSVV